MKESQCKFEANFEDEYDEDYQFGENPILSDDIFLVPKDGLEDVLGKPEDAACHEVNLRFGGIKDLSAEQTEPEELVCCQDSNIEMDLCDFKEGYSCMQEKVGRHFSIRWPKYKQQYSFPLIALCWRTLSR